MQRRQFLGLAALSIFGSALATDELLKQSQASSATKHLYSANDNLLGQHFLSRFDLGSGQLQQQKVPIRGHATLALNQDIALLFGRRPAFECVKVDFNKQTTASFKAAPNHHFNGHGCLSADHKLLFTTETDYANKRGMIGIRELSTLKQMGEYQTYGLDPHDLQLLPDGKTLVIANGGIETHPDFGRRKLNLETMQPSLVYVDIATGQKLAEYRLPDRLLSIRHLTVTAKGEVAVALQYEGDLYQQQPSSLVAWQPVGGELKLLQIAPTAVAQLRGYLADIVYDPVQQLLVSATPRGHCVSVWSTATERFVQAYPLAEASGVSLGTTTGSFLVSTGQGGLYQFEPDVPTAQLRALNQFAELVWDNHLLLS
ncbi:MAG: DUF1513 domain-containing protein [Thiolinea sp.]